MYTIAHARSGMPPKHRIKQLVYWHAYNVYPVVNNSLRVSYIRLGSVSITNVDGSRQAL